MEPNKRKGTAYHEAGHVVIGVLLGKHVEFVKLDAKHEDGTPGAFTRWTTKRPSKLNASEALREGIVLVAGYEAQDEFARETYEAQSDWSDRADVTLIARQVEELDKDTFEMECRKNAKEMLKEPKVREAIELIAQRFMQEEGQIDGAELEQIVTNVAGLPR